MLCYIFGILCMFSPTVLTANISATGLRSPFEVTSWSHIICMNTSPLYELPFCTGCPKKMRLRFCLISRQPNIGFSNSFFSWKLRSIPKFWIQNHFYAILGGRGIYKTKYVLKLINSYSCCLIVASKPQNLHQAPPTGPRWAQVAPKWLLVGLVTQTDGIDVITVFILIVFKICGYQDTKFLQLYNQIKV